MMVMTLVHHVRRSRHSWRVIGSNVRQKIRTRMRRMNSTLAASSSGSGRPFVTIAYAQSVEGNLTLKAGHPTRLSCNESMKMTHDLRRSHDAILVGVETVIADDPSLTVRRVEPFGDHPRPVVLDSSLRIPTTAKLLTSPKCVRPIVFCTRSATPEKVERVRRTGADVCLGDADECGRVNLRSALRVLHDRGYKSIMVEGGSTVLTSFFERDLVDSVISTVSPCLLLGGSGLASSSSSRPRRVDFGHVSYYQLGDDLVFVLDR